MPTGSDEPTPAATETASAAMLRGIPLFEGLSAEERQELAAISRIERVPAGAFVLREGQQRASLWAVLEGECEVLHETTQPATSRESIVLARLGPRSNFGEMSFFHPAPHSASVRARTATKLLVIDRADFDRLDGAAQTATSKLKDNTLRSLATRIRQLDEWVTNLLANDDAPQRIEEWKAFRQRLFSTARL